MERIPIDGLIAYYGAHVSALDTTIQDARCTGTSWDVRGCSVYSAQIAEQRCNDHQNCGGFVCGVILFLMAGGKA
ncbi:hypothetical protein HDU96_011050 [Phlyctochytrium bullatum]|nr:hypothetical protein HDU96_011050 [Phlyctochytrium bullatum]